jgi:hypothetical protein
MKWNEIISQIIEPSKAGMRPRKGKIPIKIIEVPITDRTASSVVFSLF